LRLLAAERITALNQTPSAFYQLMLAEEEDPARAEQLALRAVIFGGEALDLRRLRGWYARHEEDGPVLVNMYGITETTVHVTYRRLTEEMARTSEGSVIGGNIPDLRVYVLDRYLQPAPMGVTGEIYVSGAGLAQGYLNRAGLTAERFVADPFSHEPGARMYRSGDVGRWRRDGVLEYSGRADQQVKIRGFRIELGEIEEALRHQAGVAAVAVVAREETSGGQRLVAYVVPVKGSELEIAELKREAAKRLPEYMVPAAFVFLEKLPLTANGKLDRRSLPDPEMKGDAWEAPRNPREEVLCGLFAEVLGAERVGIHDNFFDLGGHSLLAARLVSHVRAALKVELALRTLFESPTVAELAGRLNESQEAARPPLVPQPRPERLPLSYVQQRLWFVHKLEGSNASYNIPVAGRMKGELDPRALEQALWDVFNRHESLRSVFPDHDGVPCQQVLPAEMARPPLPVESLKEEELQDRLDAVVANCCIQLEEELPLKAWLFRVGPDDHVLLFIMHHIMSDGWSLAPLARDLQQAYHARLRGEAPAFKELPVQYADYTLWQRSLLGDESDGRGVPAGQMEFWKKALAGAPEEIDLPAPAVRPARGSHATEIIPISFDADLHKDVLALARACGATLFMVLQAGLAALLSRLGAGDDIPVGTIVAGRADAALDDLIGLFINTLVMRTDVSGNPDFAELVKRVRSFALEAYANQDVPFERLVEELRPLRSTIRHPLFQVMLVLQNTPEVALDPGWQALQIDPLAGEEGRLARYDISVSLSEDRDADGSARGIRGHLEYRVDLLDRATALAIAERLIRLLKQAVADPGAPLSRLDILSPEERRTLLYEFNATTLDVPAATIPDLFEAQAARAPQSDAVIFNGESMSYGELNERANRLAHLLIGNGAGPESLVGIALERSSLMTVAIFAVLKAGAAYLPLDPAYPQARLAHMIGEARPGIILTTSNVVRGLPPAEGTQILELDSPETDRALLQSSAQNPTRVLLLRHPAYVIYTSGSTGVPKGVVVTHAGIASLAGSQVSRFELGPDARILQFASLNFDVSLWEFVMAISSGAALVLVRDERGGEPLKDLIVAQRVTHAVLPLGVLATLEEHGELPLRCLINGGEALPADVVARWSPGRNVINAYGPTESTVCATMAGPLSGADVPPIGSPIFNTQVYLLDAGLEPVPVGIAGELYIAGAGLARGYVHRPGLTAERFVANPFGAEAGARMYRTGDLARRRSDGLIDYVGRADQQVKVRGLRVEPGEIENVLKALPDVDQAVVSTREDLPGGRQLVAYIVPVKGASPADADLRQALTEHLPGSMIPAAFVTLDSLPRLPNGKLDRKSLPAPAMVRTSQKKFQPPASALEQTIAGVWQDVLPDARLGIQDNFFDLGGHSLLLIRVHSRLQKALNAKLPMVKLFEHPTIASLAGYLESREQQTVKVDGDAGSAERRFSSVRAAGSEIAIIGMACRFPGAPSVQTFWENLKQGIESIGSLPRNELDELAALPAGLIANPNFVAAAGRLEAVDKFDAALFGLNPAEATATDPQQRLMMECAWEALESAGYNPGGRSIGVFAGAGESLYRDLLRGDPAFEESVGGMQLVIGTGKDHLAPRLSYLLDLRGPSVPVNTACSTSLVAVHIACRSLLNFECEMALAGGVSLSSPSGYLWQEGGILSPDGHCRAFDASAQGTVPGSGAGLVVLKRLEEAVADGDHIHAVIRGSAINNDGNAKVGYTAPSVEGQRAVIERALEASGVKPEQITCIEAHGTATPLGDPIEVEALRQVFAGADSSSRCALGSVKTNIGHCDSAAGIASLIKTVLCVENRTLVPSLHFDRPNPQLDLEHSPFYVSSQTTAWEDEQRLAGVSSFGIGGTNAHVVLGPAPAADPSGPSREWQVFTLSANTEHALEKKKADLARFLTEHPEASLADVAFTLNSGRKALPVCQAFVCRTRDEALAALADPAIRPVRVDPGIGRSVVFLFPGQGKAYANLGQELYRKEVLFCQEVDRCCESLTPLIGADLRDLLFAKDGKLPEQIRRPLFWQPALFVVEYALARLWMSWGVKPAAMLGHSLGEYVAATLAGVLDLEDALKLVAERARCTELLEAGAMLAVPAGEAQINPCIKDRVSLAAVNAPELCVLAGPVAEIDLLAAELEIFNPIRLEASHAFHSPLVEPIMEPLTRLASAFTLRPPRIPYLSNVSGAWIRDDEATSPGYWAKHLRNTVRFGDCLAEAVRKPGSILLEVGPGKVLSDLARRSFADVPALPSLGEGTPNELAPARALASLWSAGAAIDWQAFYAGEKRRRVALPAYPFDRQSYWIDSGVTAASIAEAKSSLSVKNAPEDWLYAPTWKRVARRNRFRPEALRKTTECWLVFNDERGIGASLAERLRQAGQIVFEVRSGEAFEDRGDRVFTVNPESPGDYALVLTALREADRLPRRIIHAWGVPSGEPAGNAAEIGTGFDSLIYLAQALAAHQTGDGVRLGIVTANLHRVLDERPSHPAGAAVLGVAAVLPKENPQIVCICIDLDRDEADAAPPTEEILAEMMADVPEGAVACRRGHRWIPEIDRIEIDRGGTESSLHENGVYIVTHAMQELGFALAERLADRRHARVVLVDKTFFPHRSDWDNWVREQGEDDLISRRIARLKAIQGQVRVLSADAANREQMARLAGEVERDFGAITGVFRLEAAAPTGLIQGKAVPPSAVLRKDLAELEAMEEIFARAKLRVMISGNMGEIGGLGQSEQAARNGVLGLFAERLAQNGQPTITIELGTRAWSEAEEESPDSGSFIYQQLEEKRRRFGMTTEECLDAIERALAMNDDDPVLSRVIVSTRDFAALMEQQHLFTADFFRRQIQTGPSGNGASGGDLHQRPEISTDYEAPGSDVEKTLAGIWKSTLRFDRIGIHDNFFELGGHSLLALQLLKNINESFSSRITLKDLFSSATVAGIAGLISLANAEPEEDVDELEALLADIEGMPEERLREELRSARKETEVSSHD